MSTETTPRAIGRRYTAVPASSLDTFEVGQVLFCNSATAPSHTWFELSEFACSRNMDHTTAPLGAWLGSTNGVSRYVVGRVLVVAELQPDRDRDLPRYSVRTLDEGPEAYWEAAQAAPF